MPYTLSVDLDAMEGAPPRANGAYLDEGSFQPLHSAASISHAYGLSPNDPRFADNGAGAAPPIGGGSSEGLRSDFVASTSSVDHLSYDQDLPWPFNHLSEHPSSKHYDAHFFGTATLPRLRNGGLNGAGLGGGAETSHVGSLVVTLLHSLGVHFKWAKRGLVDANRWGDAWKLISSSQQVRMGVIKGLLLSTFISVVVFFFELAFIPGQLYQRQSDSPDESFVHGSWLNTFFLYPLIGGCYLLAASWTTEVAQSAYALQRNKAKKGDGERMSALAQGISEFTPTGAAHLADSVGDGVRSTARTANSSLSVASIASQIYRLVLVVNYTLLGMSISKLSALLLPGYLRYFGEAISFTLMCWVDAYYCFELLYIAKGWGFEKRARYTEMRWSYFVGFGIPSTAISYFHTSGLLNLMLFMLVFPFCSVLALLADPHPHDTTVMQTLVPGRLCILFPTVRIHRWIVKNVVRSAYGRQSFGSTSTAAASSVHAIGNGFQHAFTVGKKSNAAQFVGQIWDDATKKGGAGSNRYANGYQGTYGQRPYIPNGASAMQPPTYGHAANAGAGDGVYAGAAGAAQPAAHAYGYANYPTQPAPSTRIAQAPPPKGSARRTTASASAGQNGSPQKAAAAAEEGAGDGLAGQEGAMTSSTSATGLRSAGMMARTATSHSKKEE